MKEYLFVYGTLRREMPLHSFIEKAKLKFVDDAKLEGHDMYEISNIPVVIKGKGVITGEVFELDGSMDNFIFMKFLDQVECDYNRMKLKVRLKSGKEIEAYVYIFKKAHEIKDKDLSVYYKKIEGGDWKRR